MSYVLTDANWIAAAKFLIIVNAANFLLGCYRDYLAWRVRTLSAKNAALRAKLGVTDLKKPEPVIVKIEADDSQFQAAIKATTLAIAEAKPKIDAFTQSCERATEVQTQLRRGMN